MACFAAAGRIILIAIALVLATVVLVEFVLHVERVLVWMVVVLFFTAALYQTGGLARGTDPGVRHGLGVSATSGPTGPPVQRPDRLSGGG